ncbi:MAG TPA: CDP-alcohol phosphatidyltransferase family protein [Gemmatimonadaceae bacterium]|nr:CDP-alcohol phosphatidyltransferase family protein [Gemmatimonadaceae bacterium]
MNLNLPNTITAGRILAAPFIAALPFIGSPAARAIAFVLYVIAALTDYYDGWLARTRNLITDLGRLLDPLADKLLLFATLIPMFVLMAPPTDPLVPTRAESIDAARLQFQTPWGSVGLPWWIAAIVIGREIFMTVFRQAAARRGVVISAIGPAKWKTAFQSLWVGSAYFWFFASTLAVTQGWSSAPWRAFAYFNGIVGTLAMIASVFLTLYSLALYLKRYSGALAA